MPGAASVFPLWHISLTALIAFAASLTLLSSRRSRFGVAGGREALWVAGAVGLSVLAWRLAGNVPALNDDPVPLFSPNDLLCPVVTYALWACTPLCGRRWMLPGGKRHAPGSRSLRLS